MSLTKKQPPKCLAQSHDRSDLNSASTRRLPIEADHISVVQRGLLKMVKRSRSLIRSRGRQQGGSRNWWSLGESNP